MASMQLGDEQEREVERLLALANVQRLRGHWVEAEDSCRQALAINPKDAIVREMLGDILWEGGKLDAAVSEYKTAMDHAPGKPSLETKYAKISLEIAEREREKTIAEDMLANPHRYRHEEKNATLACLLSAVVPGLGQLYNGEFFKAGVVFGVFLVFIVTVAFLTRSYGQVSNIPMLLSLVPPAGWVMGMMALLAYVYGVIDAPVMAKKLSQAGKVQS